MAPRLGELLVRERACTPEAVRAALENQVIFGGRLGTNLLEIQAVTEEALSRALGDQHRLPSLFGAMRLDPHATALLRPEVADRYEAVPYVLADRRLALLVVDPNDLAMLDEVAFVTGKQVHPIVVPEARVWALLRQTYGVERHLRGIEVEFGKLRASAPAAAEGTVTPVAPASPGDLMDETAFDALYAKGVTPWPPLQGARAEIGTRGEAALIVGGPPGAPPPEDEVVELTDLLAPEPPTAPASRPVLAPEVVAALSGAAHAPPSRLVRPAAAPPRDEPEPSPLAFDDALRFLEGVDERGAIAKTVLRYARSKFKRAVLFTVHRGAARGWAGLGERLSPAAVRRIQLALGTPGVMDTVVKARAHFLGPLPKTEANIRLLKALGGGVPANALLVPILALGRVVNVFYADNGRGGVVDASGVGELLILATRIAKSYGALLARVRG